MKAIAKEDIVKIKEVVDTCVEQLSTGNVKTELEIQVGDGMAIANVSGAWARNTMQIVVRFRE